MLTFEDEIDITNPAEPSLVDEADLGRGNLFGALATGVAALIGGGLFSGGGNPGDPISDLYPKAPQTSPVDPNETPTQNKPEADPKSGLGFLDKLSPLDWAQIAAALLGGLFGGGGGSGGSGGGGKLINGRPESWGPAPVYTGPSTLPGWKGQPHTPQYLSVQPGNSLKNPSRFTQGAAGAPIVPPAGPPVGPAGPAPAFPGGPSGSPGDPKGPRSPDIPGSGDIVADPQMASMADPRIIMAILQLLGGDRDKPAVERR